MSNLRTLQRSFAGGEVTPELYGRIDDAKYQTGVAQCKNFIPKPQGPVENRAGFAFVRAVKDSTKKTRLIPFTYSSSQTMVIELGAGYFRFHTMGATLMSGAVPYEVVNPYAEADLFDIHYVQSADVLTLTHPNHPPKELRRMGATNWVLDTILFTPRVSPPARDSGSASSITHTYKVTAIVPSSGTVDGYPPYNPGGESQPTAGFSCSNDLTLSGAINTLTWAPAMGASSYRVYKSVAGTFYYLGTADKTSFVDSSGLTPNTGVACPAGSAGYPTPTGTAAAATVQGATPQFVTATPNAVDATYTYRYVVTSMRDTEESTASSTAQCTNNLYTSGRTNTITWPSVAGIQRYRVYKEQNGLYGYIGEASGTSFIDDNIAPDLGSTPPVYSEVFLATGDYPGAASYFEQRRIFAGSINAPQSVWGTKSGTETNMSYSIPVRDDDRISFRIAAREANAIRHIVPLTNLILLTSAAEWRVTSINSDAITPSSISVRPQSYIGASNVQPVIVNTNLLYSADRGGHIRELSYNWQANGYISGDLSLRATHLFDNYTIIDMAYSKAPMPLVWFVRSDGVLLGLTYVPEQQVGAWHWHNTDGTFESCCVVAEGAEDVLYVVVRRLINGGYVRYVERMASRQFVTQSDAFFVDSGLTYDGAAASTISGLDHLEGKVVSILSDGAVHPQRTVTAGAITLDRAASKVQIGLPIRADLLTLPMAAQLDGAFGQGRTKNVNKAWLRVYRSSGIFVGPSEDRLTEVKQRTTEPYGSPPALKSEEVQLMLTPSWADGGQVFICQYDPLPLTICNLTLEIAIGG